MKQASQSLLVLAVALALGLPVSTSAQEKSTDPASSGHGLIGENYLGASYVWYKINDSPVDATGYDFEANYAFRPNVDFTMTYSWLRTDEFLGVRARLQTVLFGLRVYSDQSWGRPYLEAAGGWASADAGGVVSESSTAYRVGAGVEFQPTAKLTLTPFINYYDLTSVSGSGTFNYGLRGAAWISRHWALTASVFADDSSDTTYSVGMNFRF